MSETTGTRGRRRFRILTVCTGNLHRSPLAEALLRTWSDWYLDPSLAAQVGIGSAGLAAPVGRAVPSLTATIARALKADTDTHRATALTTDAVSSADLVLTATARQRDEVVGLVPAALQHVFTIREAGATAAALREAEVAPDGAPTTVADLRARRRLLTRHRQGGALDIVDPHRRPREIALQMAAEEVPALAMLAQVLLGMPDNAVDAYTRMTTDRAALAALVDAAERAGAP